MATIDLHHNACGNAVLLQPDGEIVVAGANRIAFGDELTATKKLAPGTYSVTITASAGGAAGAPTTITLTIKR